MRMASFGRARVACFSRRIGFYFFFSSRRRHTRFDCDWSSDVCSSDLERARDLLIGAELEELDEGRRGGEGADAEGVEEVGQKADGGLAGRGPARAFLEIGRASCRERV